MLEKFAIDEKTLLDLDVHEDRIIITRAKVQRVITLEELFSDFEGEYEMTEEMKQWEGLDPVGGEIL